MSVTGLKSASICHHHCYIKEQQTPKLSRVCSSTNQNSRNGPTGDSGPKAQTPKAIRKFHAIWCLMFFMNQSSMNDEASIFNPLSFPLDCHGEDVCVLISGTVTYSGVQPILLTNRPALHQEGNRKLIVPWSSFNTHRTTDNAHACLLSHQDGLYIMEVSRPSNGLHNRQ